jgi:hypothetical protein
LIFRRARQASGSFLKKRTKKLLLLRALVPALPRPPANRSFLLLFFKKEALASLLSPLGPNAPLPHPQHGARNPGRATKNPAKTGFFSHTES